MRTSSTKRAIRNALFRLGLHTPLTVIVRALREQNVHVDEALVRQVRFEMIRQATKAMSGELTRLVPTPAVRRRPKGFPGRRGQ